jgi:Mn2+/Fe2+ NRAMP family transporter
MATTAYVVGAHLYWRRGLSEGIGRARGFYAVLVASVGLSVAVSLAGISVIGTLVAASVIGGFGTPVGLVILRLARDPQVMGSQPISGRLAIAGWAVAVIIGGFGLLAIIGAPPGHILTCPARSQTAWASNQPPARSRRHPAIAGATMRSHRSGNSVS